MIGSKVLEEKESKYNGKLRVVRTLGLGTYIQADGLTQSGGIVESMWRQTLKKVSKDFPEIHTSLILGLGGGSAVKVIRKIWPKAKSTGVDIDPSIVELGKRYLVLNDKDVQIRITDASSYDATGYDLVIVDLYKGDKFPKEFENKTFLKRLTGNKVVVFNRIFYGDKKREALGFGNLLEKYFNDVERFYPEINLMFICKT